MLESRAGAPIQGTWEISLRDLDDALSLDDDGDGAITWGELRAHQRDLEAYALPKLRFRAGGSACSLAPTGRLETDSLSDGGYAVLRFSLDCPASGGALELSYQLLFELDPTHRGIVRTSGGGLAVFSPEKSVQLLALSAPATRAGQLMISLREGMRRSWPGALFLVALLASLGLRRSGALASLFVAASSVALTCAVVGGFRGSPRSLGGALALSLVLALASNRIAFLPRQPLAFFAGLAHGLWLAGNLTLQPAPASRALLGFNLGSVLGQLALAALALWALHAAQRAVRSPKLLDSPLR